ncbi:MAG: carbon dioxide concentrating mechanism protein [Lyngbya sp. HA4199-MV5]|jgi:carbon dioxide concentrating mechanism protein CcmN|nr:carbon dioxide concentrating mechanism protein [Lyngbya sp. HA4199-MV5]
MHVPSLQPVTSDHFCVSGDVTIHPTAVIAAGVLLQADPASRIVIGAGACLGMGTVLHAHQGTLEVEAEVTIGAGVLIIGAGKIGTSACIGAASTIWNHSIGRGEIIPPLSLLGMPDQTTPVTAETSDAPPVPASPVAQQQEPPNGTVETAVKQPAAEIQLSFSTPVYGQENLNRLLSTLLPHRQTFLKGQE